MDLQQLQYFRKLAHIEHVGKASEELFISQPSLSLSLKKLETELGVELFDRKNRGIKLNKYGDYFLEKTELALSILEEAKSELLIMKDVTDNSIKLSVPPHLCIPELFDEFTELNNKFQIVLLHDASTWQVMLENGHLDFFVGTSTPRSVDSDNEICSIPLYEEHGCILVKRNSKYSHMDEMSIVNFANENFAALRRGKQSRNRLIASCIKAGFEPKIAYESDDYRETINIVKSGKAVALFPLFATNTYNLEGLSVIRLPQHEYLHNKLKLFWVKDRQPEENIELLKNIIIKYINLTYENTYRTLTAGSKE